MKLTDTRQARRHHHRSGEVFLVMSDQLNFGPESQPKLRLAAQGDRVQAPARPVQPPPVAALPVPVAPPAADAHLTDYVKVVYKRRWTAATVFLLVMAAVTVYTFTATPIFEARTRLLIEAESQNVVVVQGSHRRGSDQGRLLPDAVQHPAEPRAGPQDARGPEAVGSPAVQSGEAGQGLQRGAGDRRRGRTGRRPVHVRPGGGHRAGRRRRDRGAVEGHRHVRCAPDRRADPQQPARRREVPLGRCGAGVGHRERAGAELHRAEPRVQVHRRSKDATDWLGEQLAEQRKQVEAAEAKLQAYREQNDAISLEDRREHRRPEAGRPERGGDAREDRADPEGGDVRCSCARSRTIRRRSTPSRRFSATPSSSSRRASWRSCSSSSAQLSEKLGEKHPEIVKIRTAIQGAQAKLQAEIAKVVAAVRNEYQAALAQEDSLSVALGQQKGEALSMNRKGIDYSVLERDVQSNKQLYESLLQRTKETGVAGELKTQQHPGRRQGRAAAHAGHAAQRHEHAAGAGVGICPGLRAGVLLRVPRQPHQDAGRAQGAPRAAVPRHGAGARRQGMEGQAAAAARRRSAGLRRGVPHHPHQRAVLVGGGRLARRSSSPAPDPARARRWWRATWRLASRRPASGCCSSTPTCAGRACTTSSASSRSRASRTCWWATRRRARACTRRPCPGCGCWPPAAFRRTRRSCSARSASATS